MKKIIFASAITLLSAMAFAQDKHSGKKNKENKEYKTERHDENDGNRGEDREYKKEKRITITSMKETKMAEETMKMQTNLKKIYRLR